MRERRSNDIDLEGSPEQLERLIADLHAEDPALRGEGAAGVERFLRVKAERDAAERVLVDVYADDPELQSEGRAGVERFLASSAGARREPAATRLRPAPRLGRFARTARARRVAAVVACAVSSALAWYELPGPAATVCYAPEPSVAPAAAPIERQPEMPAPPRSDLPLTPVSRPSAASKSASTGEIRVSDHKDEEVLAAPLAGISLSSSVGITGARYAEFPADSSDESQARPAKTKPQIAIEEITVTARKREENLQETPISITAFSATDLKDAEIRRIDDIQNSVPNLQFDQAVGQANAARIQIRGVGNGDPIISNDPGVGVYIDGVYLPRAQGALLAVSDIERVEVLRGPQGTLFGKNTIGGAVNIVTQKPTMDEFKGTAEVRVGNYRLFETKTVLNVPLVPEMAAARFSIATEQRDGYTKNRFLDGDTTVGRRRQLAARGRFMLAATDNLELNLSADHSNLTAVWSPSEAFTFKSISSWRRNETHRSANADLIVFPAITEEGRNDNDHAAQNAYSQEFNFSGNSMDSKLDWMVGVYGFVERNQYTERGQALPIINGKPVRLGAPTRHVLDANGNLVRSPVTGVTMTTPDPGNTTITTNGSRCIATAAGSCGVREFVGPFNKGFLDSDTTSYAAYGQFTYDVTEAFSVTGGVRYTQERKRIHRLTNAGRLRWVGGLYAFRENASEGAHRCIATTQAATIPAAPVDSARMLGFSRLELEPIDLVLPRTRLVDLLGGRPIGDGWIDLEICPVSRW